MNVKLKIREGSVACHLLLYIEGAEEVLSTVFMPPHKWHVLSWCKNYNTYRTVVYRLVKSGFIEIVEKEKTKFLKLTRNGELQTLLAKARMPQNLKWDGKWRFVIFDIPEDARPDRALFRQLLKQNGFLKIQASVYVSPYPLNREAIIYLKESGLMKFIRILRVDEIDDDKDLKRKFDL